MKHSIKLLAALFVLGGFASCTVTTTDTYCWTEYDYYGYPYTVCEDYYYASKDSIAELDIAAKEADTEAQKIQIAGLKFADKYNIDAAQGEKIAQSIADFTTLADREEADITDIAEKLYGVNPSEIISAVSQAQVGVNDELDAVLDKAAANFNTDVETMKDIVKDLHGAALSDNGINL